MTRSVRLLASLIAIAALLFSQLALAAHGCERLAKHSPHCAKMAPASDPGPSNLCVKHCEDGKASLDIAKPLTPVALTAAVLSIPLAAVAPIASAQRTVPPATPHPPPANFAARSAALRI